MTRPAILSNWRVAAKLITRIESADPAVRTTLKELYEKSAHVPVVGITGPPGAGKSTLLDRLVGGYRSRGERVAVLVVDPSSPFTGGAILGDRIRLARHNTDPGVFIRSMASRGRLGGLASATGDALTVLQATDADRIIVETVGVGQSEVEILRHAQTVLIVQTPAGGDAVQAVKAGLLEVGDVLAVNKSDLDGADRTVMALRESIEFRYAGFGDEVWRPPVLKTRASEGHGVDELIAAIDDHIRHYEIHADQLASRLRRQTRAVLIDRIAESLRASDGRDGGSDELEFWIDEIIAHRSDPYTAATQILSSTQRSAPLVR